MAWPIGVEDGRLGFNGEIQKELEKMEFSGRAASNQKEK